MPTPTDIATPPEAETDQARRISESSSSNADPAPHLTVTPPLHAVGPVEIALLILILLIAGGTAVAARITMQEMPTFSTGFVRFAVASILLFLTTRLLPRDEASQRKIDTRDCNRILLCAFLCVPVNQACFLGGVQQAGAAHAGLLYALNPVLVYVLTLALRQAGFSPRMIIAALLAFGGAAVIFLDGSRTKSGPSMLSGDVLLFLAVASWSSYSVLVAPLGAKYGALRTLTFLMLAGTAMYAPVLLIDGAQLFAGGFSWRAWTGFAYITVLTAYLNYLLWFVGLVRVGVNRMAVAMNAAPLLSVVAAYLVLSEPITHWLALGALLLIGGITLSNWDKIRGLTRPVPA